MIGNLSVNIVGTVQTWRILTERALGTSPTTVVGIRMAGAKQFAMCFTRSASRVPFEHILVVARSKRNSQQEWGDKSRKTTKYLLLHANSPIPVLLHLYLFPTIEKYLP